MATYTYTIYDADPNSCGGCEWPTHDGLEIEADDNGEAESGEDAEAMAKRLLDERAGEPYQDGEWCVYWESSLDYDHVVRRYATCEAATAAAELLASELADRYPGRLRCGYGVRVMRDGEWVRADEVES